MLLNVSRTRSQLTRLVSQYCRGTAQQVSDERAFTQVFLFENFDAMPTARMSLCRKLAGHHVISCGLHRPRCTFAMCTPPLPVTDCQVPAIQSAQQHNQVGDWQPATKPAGSGQAVRHSKVRPNKVNQGQTPRTTCARQMHPPQRFRQTQSSEDQTRDEQVQATRRCSSGTLC